MAEQLDLSLFSDCSEALKFDEMINGEHFDADAAISAADFSGTRVDSFDLANGQVSYEDIVKRMGDIPNENATPEQVLGICGKFVDLQAARLDGHSPMLSIMTHIYMQKEFEVKHPILKFMFRLFSHVSRKVEQFVGDVLSIEQGTRFWLSMSNRVVDELLEADEAEMVAEMEKLEMDDVLVKLARFELNLTRFLANPMNVEITEEFVCPETSIDDGYDYRMRYRDSHPASTPGISQVPAHDVAIATMKRLVQEIAEVKKVFGCRQDMESLIDTIAVWNGSGEKVALARIVAMVLVVGPWKDPKWFGELSMEAFIKAELERYHLPSQLFVSPDFEPLVDMSGRTLNGITMHLLCPVTVAHKYLTSVGMKFWGWAQNHGYSLSQAHCAPLYPRCVSQEQQKAAGLVFALWSSAIAARLTWVVFTMGDSIGLYSERDIPIVTYFLENMMETRAVAYGQWRVANAVYKTPCGKGSMKRRKEADVKHRIEPPTQAEHLAGVVADVLGCCMTLQSVLVEWDCLNVKKGMFFDQEALFVCRSQPLMTLAHVRPPSYKAFVDSVEAAGAVTPVHLDAKFANARKSLIEYSKTYKDQSKLVRDMLGCVLLNSRVITGLSKSKRYSLKADCGLIFPQFVELAQ